jgi:hypothetical protein
MIWQSYWKLYHWQTEHNSGAIVMVLRHILAELCEMFSVTLMVTQRRTYYTASTLVRFESGDA